MDHPATGRAVAVPPLPRSLARAVGYLRDNLCEPLTLAAIAQASGLTERTLHNQFRRFLGMTPLAYLRRLRLLAAREQLSRTDGPGVSQVANQVGFVHLGRFSLAYKAAFGETPSTTRHQATTQPTDRIMLSRSGYALPVLLITLPRTETLAERRLAVDLYEHLAAALTHSRAFTVRLSSPEPLAGHRLEPARFCLSGRVVQQGPRARILLSLTDRQESRHLWGDSFDGRQTDPLALLDAAVKDALRHVPPAVMEAETARLAAAPDAALNAHALALRALPLAFAAAVPNARRLIAAMLRPMEMDPGAALPVALTALGLAQVANYFGSEDPDALRAQARHFYLRAAELDAGDALVTTARAATASLCYWMDDADALATRAVAMDPASHWAWERRGHHRMRADASPELVIADLNRAVRLKTQSMPRANSLLDIATAHCIAGRPDRATPLLRAALSESSADWMRRSLVWHHISAGDELRARSAVDDLRRTLPHLTGNLVTRTLKGLRWDWFERLVAAGLPT